MKKLSTSLVIKEMHISPYSEWRSSKKKPKNVGENAGKRNSY
jgi:hypothetical protein